MRDTFTRKVVDVRAVFRESLNKHLIEGRIADKEKFEQDKLKISANLINFVVSGGVLLFSGEGFGKLQEPVSAEQKTALEENRKEGEGKDDLVMNEASLFNLLRKTILLMLNELNKPDVNLLKISLSKPFREKLRSIFAAESPEEPERFPVKIFQDIHPNRDSYIAINMRNTHSLGHDIDRIEQNPALKMEIMENRRPLRHTDGNLYKMFAPPLSSPKQDIP